MKAVSRAWQPGTSEVASQRQKLFLPSVIYPPTTSQFVLSDVDQRSPVTGAFVFLLVWYGYRRTPLTGESERVLEQRGHCTKAMPLSAKRLRSMATTSEENGHLGDVLVCPCSCAVSTVCAVFCCPDEETVS